MIRVKVAPELIAETLVEGNKSDGFVVVTGLPKRARLVWVRPFLLEPNFGRRVELFFARAEEAETDYALVAQAVAGTNCEDLTPTFRVGALPGVVLRLVESLRRLAPGDAEAEATLKWYDEEVGRGA